MIQNVAEQVCRVCGYLPVWTESLSNAEATLAQPGGHIVALVVIDVRVLGEVAEDIRTQLPELLQRWGTLPLSFPHLYLGSLQQKYEALAARSAPVPFLTIPFSAHQFGEAVLGVVASGKG